MKTAAAVCLALLLVCSAALAQSNSEEEQVRKAGDANVAAIIHRDTAALKNQYTEDYYRVGENGRVTGKADILKIAADPTRRTIDVQFSDRKFRVYGPATVVETGLAKVTAERDGKPQSYESRYTVVWRKENGTWKKAVYQATSLDPLPAEAYRR